MVEYSFNNIIFITFYGFSLYINDIKTSFESFNIRCIDFPIKMMIDNNSSRETIADNMIQLIKSNNSKIVFFFLLPDNRYFYETVKQNTDVKFIFYNFDDTISCNSDLIKFASYIDIFINPHSFNNYRYSTILNKKTYSVPLYYRNENMIENDTPEKHKIYDIVLLYNKDSTNKYDIDNIIWNIKLLSLENNYNFKLFGPEFLETDYPDIYEGIITDINQICTNTKIIINLVNNFQNRIVYDINNKHIMFYGKSILMTNLSSIDDVKMYTNINCLIFTIDSYKNKLKTILNDYDKNKFIISNAKINITTKYSIDTWSKNVLSVIESNLH